MKEDLQQRFLDFEVSPPPSLWNGIATHLNEQHDDLFLREKVLAAELEPPARTWDLIAEVIGIQQSATRQFNLFSRRQIPQAAAVLAGVILIGSFLFFNNKVKKGAMAITESAPSRVSGSTSSSPSAGDPVRRNITAQIAAGIPKSDAIYSALRFKKKNPPSLRRQLEESIVRAYDQLEIPEPAIAAKPIRNESGEIIQDLRLLNKPNNKYLSITGPNGAPTKISAKFAHFLLYLNGDNDTDLMEGVFHKSFLESLTWKARFQHWRNTLSQNAFVPTSTNFMDILELKDLILQQKDID